MARDPGARSDLERVRAICLALPEVTERLSHNAPTWFVRDQKTFVTPDEAARAALGSVKPTELISIQRMLVRTSGAWEPYIENDANYETVLDLVEAANTHDVDRQAALYSVDATNHGRPAGREGLHRVLTSLYETFPDWHYELHHAITGEDSVMALMTMTGTHTGMAQLPILGGLITGLAPTGKAVSVLHAHLFRFKVGEITEHSAVRDDLGMMQQLGLIADGTAGDISRPPRG